MTIKELCEYYESGYRFSLDTGMSATSYHSWVQKGFIPVHSQIKLESLTDGKLVARIEDGEKFEK